MTIIPITIFGILSLLYFIAYKFKDALEWPFSILGVRKQRGWMQPIRGQDPSGIKRARALREAHGLERVPKNGTS